MLASTALIAVMAALPAQAQDMVQSTSDIVVSATKTDAPLIEAPQSISVISKAEMELRGVQDLNTALSYSTGIKFRDYPGGPGIQDFYLRGFRANSNGESVYRDGLRQQCGFVTGNVEPYGLERMELLKGPASVLYGQGNPGGLINLTTKRTAAPRWQGRHSRENRSTDSDRGRRILPCRCGYRAGGRPL